MSTVTARTRPLEVSRVGCQYHGLLLTRHVSPAKRWVGPARPQRSHCGGWPIAWSSAGATTASVIALRSRKRVRWSDHRGCLARAAAPQHVQSSTERPGANPDFSSEIWMQFMSIASPYFVPAETAVEEEAQFSNDSWERVQGVGGLFLPLVAALLLGVVCGAYWLALGFGTALLAVAPASFLPPGSASTLASLTATEWYPIAAGAGVVISAASFYAAREKLSGRWLQWGLLGLLLILLLGVTGLLVLFSYIFRTIDNVLIAKNAEAYYQQLIFFAAALVVAVPVISGYRFTRFTLGRLWREYLTELFLEKYMAKRRYYLLDSNSQSTDMDNPDQRISEDIDYFTRETLSFLLDVLDSVLNLLSFSAILWNVSQQLTGALVVYSFLGSAAAVYIGGKLVEINYDQLRLQANLRYSLVHIRDNAEAIAFYSGEERERQEVASKLNAALLNYDKLIVWKTGLAAYQKAFFYLARLVPLFVLGGLYFAGEVDFGTLGQAQFAFSMVLSSVALIVSRIQDISRFAAGITRLGALWEVLNCEYAMGSAKYDPTRVIHTEEVQVPAEGPDSTPRCGIHLEALTLETPDGSRSLVEGLSLALGGEAKQRRLLVVGSSGVGKSSVLRAIAGLWTRGAGKIMRPTSRAMLFLPQRPYMPLGDLRTQLLYPADGTLDLEHGDAELHKALASFGLAHLPDRFIGGFDAVQDWARVLSLGEQQRLAAARCMISCPRFVVLDEATSALPLPMERSVYEGLMAQPNIEGYISVGHRTSLAEFHDVVLEVLGGGAWQILTPEEYVRQTQL